MKKFLLIILIFLAIPAFADTILEGGVDLKDRVIAKFSDSTYAVQYKNDPLHVFYYSANDELMYKEERSGSDYPYKFYKYDVSGNLVNQGLRVSKPECYIYSKNGKLIAHWIGPNGYDERGNLIMTREYLE